MARPRAFDTDQALERAMGVFWVHGYENASLPLLLSGMQLTRGSLYKAFTDKKTLFLAALARYDAQAVTPAVALLTDSTIPDGLDRIETVFTSAVDVVRRGDRRGCLLCTSAAGPASDDPQIAKAVNDLVLAMQSGFKSALDASSMHAHVSQEDRVRQSMLLMAHYVGLRILARSQVVIEVLEGSVSAQRQMLRLASTDQP